MAPVCSARHHVTSCGWDYETLAYASSSDDCDKAVTASVAFYIAISDAKTACASLASERRVLHLFQVELADLAKDAFSKAHEISRIVLAAARARLLEVHELATSRELDTDAVLDQEEVDTDALLALTNGSQSKVMRSSWLRYESYGELMTALENRFQKGLPNFQLGPDEKYSEEDESMLQTVENKVATLRAIQAMYRVLKSKASRLELLQSTQEYIEKMGCVLNPKLALLYKTALDTAGRQ